MNHIILHKSYYSHDKRNYIYFFISLIMIVSIYVLAPHSNDYINYSRSFHYGASGRVEPTFTILASIAAFVTNNVILLYLLYGLISIPIKLKALKELSPLFTYSLTLYICYYFLLHEVTQIRASAAVAFFLLSIKSLYDRNLKKYALFVFCAILFHYSALIMVPLWFIKPKSINKYFYLSIIPVSYILASTGISLTYLISFIPIEEIQILLKHHTYAMEQGIGDKINIFNLLQLFRCFICCALIILSERIITHNKYALLIIKIYTLSIISVVLFHDLPIVSFRISEFLGVTEVIALPFILYFFKQKFLVMLPVIMLFLYHSLYNLNLISIF